MPEERLLASYIYQSFMHINTQHIWLDYIRKQIQTPNQAVLGTTSNQIGTEKKFVSFEAEHNVIQ